MEYMSPELFAALDMAAADANEAAKVLVFAAEYLKTQQKMPYPLALFIADAFEKSMKKAPSVRGSELLLNLHLKALNKRPVKANFEYVGGAVERLMHEKLKKGEAVFRVAEDFNISEKTVQRLHTRYLAMLETENGEM